MCLSQALLSFLLLAIRLLTRVKYRKYISWLGKFLLKEKNGYAKETSGPSQDYSQTWKVHVKLNVRVLDPEGQNRVI